MYEYIIARLQSAHSLGASWAAAADDIINNAIQIEEICPGALAEIGDLVDRYLADEAIVEHLLTHQSDGGLGENNAMAPDSTCVDLGMFWGAYTNFVQSRNEMYDAIDALQICDGF